MRIVTIGIASACLLFCAFGATAEAGMPNSGTAFDVDGVQALKDSALPPIPPPPPDAVRVGGDTAPSAFEIPGIPFSDTGNTCSFNHDYDSVCPFTNSTSRDVVYKFAPASDCSVNVVLCASEYDTKVYVFENEVGNVIACNDDACGSDGWKSAIVCLPLLSGNTYYFVVDGYGGDCGTYDFKMGACDCMLLPPLGSYAEGEADCGDDFVDHYNGGCSSVPPEFIPICPWAHPVTFLGTYGGFLSSGQEARDTDWYVVTYLVGLDVPPRICVKGNYPTAIGIVSADSGCPVEEFYDYAEGQACESICLNPELAHGEWWVFVATSGFGPAAGSCPGWYFLTFEGMGCSIEVSVEPTSWGEVKALYRDR